MTEDGQLTEEFLEKLKRKDRVLYEALAKKLYEENDLKETPPYVKALFGPQYRFFADTSKRKAAVCSRRAGKTEAIAAWLLDGARDDADGLSVYIALSRNNCRLILWRTLEAINKRHNLGLRFKEVDNQLSVYTPNNHRIWLAGCKDTAEIEKFRGLKLRRAAIDEGASYGSYLRELVDDVLDPALVDLDGEMAIIGTPGVIPAGLFFDVTQGQHKWNTHTWTICENPFIPHAEKWLHDKRMQNGWSVDHPTYQREWLGLWVRDEGALVYPFDSKLNTYYKKPEGDWKWAIGVDVGYVDSTAFVVAGFRRNYPEIYVAHVEKHEGLIPSKVAAYIARLKHEWGAHMVVMDTGGLGKGYAEEASQKYGVHCEPAKKRDKRAYLEIVRGEMLSGNIKIQPHKCAPLVHEMMNLVWDEKHEAPDDRFEDHAADAFLYIVRALLPHYRPDIERKPLTEEEKATQQMVDHRAKELKRIKMMHRAKWKSGQVFKDIASGR